MYSKSFHGATTSSSVIPFDSSSVKNHTVSENFLESRLEKVLKELRNANTQLSYETNKRKQAEYALKKQQSFYRITAHFFLAMSCKWLASSKNEASPEKQSIFPVNSQLNPVFQFIEDNYYQPINLSDVAKAAGYSRAYLTNLTKRRTKRTIHSWIVERRMTEARSLLLETDCPVNQIAAKVGYPDSGHFSRQFRQIHDLPPKAWRDKHRVLSLEISA